MKQLYQVVMPGRGITFFETKKEAKEFRDQVNSASVQGLKPHVTYHVSLGPDHRNYGKKNNPRTHSHNAKSGGHGNGFPRKFK